MAGMHPAVLWHARRAFKHQSDRFFSSSSSSPDPTPPSSPHHENDDEDAGRSRSGIPLHFFHSKMGTAARSRRPTTAPSSSSSSFFAPRKREEKEEEEKNGMPEMRETTPATVIDWVTHPLPPSVRSASHSDGRRPPPHPDAGSSREQDLSSSSIHRRATPILHDGERATYLEALRSVQEEEWLALRKRRQDIQSEEAAKQGSHLPPRMEEAVQVDTEVLQSALRYHAGLELAWIEEWATAMAEEAEKKKGEVEEAERRRGKAQEHPLPKESTAGMGEPTLPPTTEGRRKEEEGSGKASSTTTTLTTRHRVKRALLERIDYRKPLAYITGSHVFYGCPLTCAYPVWCPREETSMWAYWLVQTHWKPCIEAIGKTHHHHHPPPRLPPSRTAVVEKPCPSTEPPSASPCRTSFDASSFFFRFPSSSMLPAGGGGADPTVGSLPPIRILDMCCGNGAIGIALAKQWPSHCCVVGVDVDAKAVALAHWNAQMNGLEVFPLEDAKEVGEEAMVETKVHHRSKTPPPPTPTTTPLSSSAMGGAGTAGVIRRYWAIQGDMFAALQGGEQDGEWESSLSTPTPPPPPLSQTPTHPFTASSSSLSSVRMEKEAEEHPPPTEILKGGATRRDGETDATAAMVRRLSPAFLGQFDLLVCHPPYLLPREYETLSIHEQYWNPPLAVLGDPTRRGLQQYRYFKELCEVGPALLTPQAARHPAMRAMPQIVVEVGRQASLVAELFEKQQRNAVTFPADPGPIATAPKEMDRKEEKEEGPSPHTTTSLPPPPLESPPRRSYRLSSLFPSFGSSSSPPSEVEKGAWEDVQVHLDAHQLPRWICARATH